MLAIRAGDHIGVSFAASASFAITTASFSHQALDAGGQVIVFPGELTSESAKQLSESNLRLRQASRSGQFSFADSGAVQMATGRFDPVHLHQIYAEAATRALAAGYTGLWVSVDMSWAKPGIVAPQALTTFEAEAFPLFRERTLTAICYYDTRIFPEEAARDACSAHPASLRAATMRFSYRESTLVMTGDTDLTNRIAFETIIGTLTGGDTVDLTGMGFLDVYAAARLAQAAHAHPGLRFVVSAVQRELLTVAGVPAPQMVADPL